MANTLGNYTPQFYADEMLIWLKEALGLGMRVYRPLGQRTANVNETVNFRRPMKFVAGNAPTSAATDVNPRDESLTMDKWKDVVFSMTDKELSLSIPQLVEEHIKPAAFAIAKQIEIDIASLASSIAPATTWTATAAPADILAARELMMRHLAPPNEQWHMAITNSVAQDLLGDSAFSQQQGAGDLGVNTQQSGSLGRKFGFDIFETQILQSITTGAMSDAALTINNSGGYAKGTSTINIDAGGSDNIEIGHVLEIAETDGTTRHYVTKNQVAPSGGAYTGVQIQPPLEVGVADGAAVTVSTGSIGTKTNSIGFHPNCMCLVMAEMDQQGPRAGGVESAARTDETSGLSIRVTKWYEGKEAALYCRADALYGVKVLDPHLGVRITE